MTAAIVRGKATRADLAQWDGVTSIYSRIDASGGTVTGLAVGNEVDVLQVYGSGTSRSVGSISAAIIQIGSRNATLVFAPGTWTIDSNLTIPSNFTCHVPSGCVFAIDSGITLTLSGRVLTESNTWFSGAGSVSAPGGLQSGVYFRTAAEVSASVTPTYYNYPEGYALRYGAVADGSTDDKTAIQNAINVMEAKGGGKVILEPLHKIASILTIDNHGVVLECPHGASRATAISAGGRLIYTGGATAAIKLDGASVSGDILYGVGLKGFRLENQGTGTIGVHVLNCQNCNFEEVHVREFSADNWLYECDTTASCIYNYARQISGWTAAGTAIGIRFVEGAGKAVNNNLFEQCHFGNNLVGIQQDSECHETVFNVLELGSCTTGALLRGRTTMLAANIENCTTGVNIVSGSAASLTGAIHFGSNSTDISNTGNLSVFASMHGSDSGSPVTFNVANTAIGMRGATPPSTGGINFSTTSGDPKIQLAGANHLIFESGNIRVEQPLEINDALNHDGSSVGFYGTAPIAKQTGVAVSAAGIHAALVALGLIAA